MLPHLLFCRLFTARGVVFGVGKPVTLCTSPQFTALLLQRTRDLACVQPEAWGHRPLSRGPEAGSTACVLGEAWPCRTLCSPRLLTLPALVPALDTGPEALGDAGLLLWLLLGEMGLHDLSSCSWRLGTGMCHAVLGASPTAITEQQKHVLLCGRDPGSGGHLLSCPALLLQSQGWGRPCSCEGWGSSAASAGRSLLPPCPCPGRSGWATRLLSPADWRFISSNGHLSVIHVCGGKSTLCALPGHPAPGPVISTSWGRFCQCLPKFPSTTHSCRCCLAFPSRTDLPHCSPFFSS